MLEGALDFREEDSPDDKLGKLERGLAHVGLELDEAVPLAASVLSLRIPERYAPLQISPHLQRQRTLEALLAWVLTLGEKQPLVLLVEDLHWVDPSTREWLGLLIEQCPTASVLLLMTHRPEFEPPWPGRGHVLSLALNRLTRRQSRELVARSTAEGTLSEEAIERIASRSDGVPLFVEELAREVVEAGGGHEHEIPETLQDSLMARLDRLGEAAHYQEAAQRAMERSAQTEAIDDLRRAIALLAELPATPERDWQELQLQLARGTSLIGARGHGDPEVERVHERARELCQRVGEGPELVRALIGLSMFHFMRGRLRVATELAEQALALAEQMGQAYLLLAAHTRLGITLLFSGALTRAIEHLERAVDLYDPASHRPLAVVWGQDWGISARNYLGLALWKRGCPDRASWLGHETVELARRGDPFSLAFALTWSGLVAGYRGDREQALEQLDEAIAISRERGFPIWEWEAESTRAGVLGGSRGLAELEQKKGGDPRPGMQRTLLDLARLSLELGRTADARAAVDTALGQHSIIMYGDAHRIQAEIFRQEGEVEQAEASFRRALEIGHEHDAKSFELRAATGLARLLRDQGRRDEARDTLRPVYGWFTEGFDTADLKDAAALLEELG